MNRPESTGNISNIDSNYCQLLVSVRDADEANLCLKAGVDWIDLKEPSEGSLGMPSLDTAQQVAFVLADHQSRSVALGELSELLVNEARFEVATALSQLFPIAKVGLANIASLKKEWQYELSELLLVIDGQLTPVIYADWMRCSAPNPFDVIQWASDYQSPYLLIDTYHKDGRKLLDYLTIEELALLVHRANQSGTQVVLAGSLTMSDVPILMKVPCSALAVRGAACRGDRRGSLCPSRLSNWVTLIGGYRFQEESRTSVLLNNH